MRTTRVQAPNRGRNLSKAEAKKMARLFGLASNICTKAAAVEDPETRTQIVADASASTMKQLFGVIANVLGIDREDFTTVLEAGQGVLVEAMRPAPTRARGGGNA
jgi:hypothetical protein